MNSESFSIIETILEKSKQLEAIQRELPFNPEVSHNLANRLKTCIAQVQKVEEQPINSKKYEVLLSLNFNLNRGVEILYQIAGEELIFDTWNGNQEIVDIESVFHSLSANLIDLELKNIIMVNTGIESLQEKVKEIFENLRNSVKSFENLSQMQDSETIQTLAEILSCQASDVLKVHEKYLQYFRLADQEIQINEFFKQGFIFTSKAAQVFWLQHFGLNSHTYWLQFKSKISEVLEIFKYQQTTRVQLVQLIRKKVDRNFSGMVSQSSCDWFFNHFSFDLEKIIPELEPVRPQRSPMLTLRVMSSLTAGLKVGSSVKINLNSYEDSVVVIGRESQRVNIAINEPSISAVHATISHHPDKGLTYTDLGSTGGTFTQITSALALNPGQVLQLASSQMIHIRKVVNFKPSKLISDIPVNEIYPSENFNSESFSKIQLSASNHLGLKNSKNDTIAETSSEKEHSSFINDAEKSRELLLSQISSKSLNEKLEEAKETLVLDVSNIKIQDSDVRTGFKEKSEVFETSFIEFEFVLKGSNQGRIFKFSGSSGEVTIGRDAACTIRLNDDFISSVHATIQYGELGWQFSDKSSRNKSWVCLSLYDELVSRTVSGTVRLDPGKLIKLGTVDFLIEVEN